MMRAPARRPLRGTWRRRLGVACLAVGLLLGAATIVSIKWWFGYCGEARLVDFGDGAIYTRRVEENQWSTPLLGWHGGVNNAYVNNAERSWTWTWWSWGETDEVFDKVHVYSVWPLSPALLLLGGLLAFPGWRGARRARRGLCPACAYSRAGLSDAVPCPECGHEQAQA